LYSSSLANNVESYQESSLMKCGSRCERWLGRSLYQLELPLLQFTTEHGQMLGVATARGRCLAVFPTVDKLVIFGGRD
jgi:hypothetical protein